MFRKFATFIAGFIVLYLSAAIISISSNIFLEPMFGAHIRSSRDVLFVPLVAGYFIVALCLYISLSNFSSGTKKVQKGFIFGAVFGAAVFLGGHIIIAGWSVIAFKPLLISGLLDILPVSLSGAVLGALSKNKSI